MPEPLVVDLCVIGTDAGGLEAAILCALAGAPVALIAADDDRARAADARKAALLAAARRAADVRSARAFGISTGRAEVDFAALRAHLDDVAAAAAPARSAARLGALGVRVVRGPARFTGADAVEAGGVAVRARRFVVATGAVPALPQIPGFDAVPCLTGRTILDLAACPSHLAVLGGDAEGLELAQALRRLGAEVTVFVTGSILAGEDAEMAAVLRRALAAEGIALHEQSAVLRVEEAGGAIRIHAQKDGETGTLDVSHLLAAAGRTPDIAGLGLEAAGIAFTAAGIIVDAGLRTTNRRVHAIGAAAAGGSAEAAPWQGAALARNILFRLPVRADRAVIPRLVRTDPALAHVGLSEAEARARDPKARVLRWPFADNDQAAATRRRTGHVKLVVGRRGAILGCSIAGAEAGDLIAPYAAALAKRMTVAELAGLALPCPTLAEAGKRAAGTYFLAGLSNPWAGRIIRLLRRLG